MISVAPPPLEVPANAIAVVAEARAGHAVRIDKGDFRHALVLVAAQKERPVPQPGHGGYGRLRDIATGELLASVWIKGQAGEMGVGTTRREVARELARLKKAAFRSPAEYRRFLREAHYTRRDVNERVEIQILSTRIQERAVAGIEGRVARQRAFAKFVREFNERWRARTVCAPEYVLPKLCSNG